MIELASHTLSLARAKGLKLATAESCTGGMISAALTAVAGSSDVFDRGFVTYSNDAKGKMLNVSSTALNQFGAVSTEVAQEMANGAITQSLADIAVSVTGIAGPGGSEHKPEGLVCFGICARDRFTISERIAFGALGREQVRIQTVNHALAMLDSAIKKWS